jgi:myo-inositol 2-dehydrogenase/D-chiro-inositol 1-dehydrogenase
MADNKNRSSESNRREFMRGTTTALVAGAVASQFPSGVRAADAGDKIRIALIGCGGRGTGAAGNNLKACVNTEITAVADAFEDKAKSAAKKFNVSPEKTFWGLDAYKKAIDSGIDMVIMATPPGFRPLHYKAAIEAGKHVFMEKPCCVDAPGYRMLVETNKLADQNGLKVGVGLQRRHQDTYVNGIQQIHDGKYGDLVLLRAYWNGGGIWHRGASADRTEMENQVNNWYHFVWLSGDNICEQHVHNLDVCNWAKNALPVEANGMGGAEIRKKMFGTTQLFDHHFVEFTYPDGSKMYSQCRHAQNCWGQVSEAVHGTKGYGSPRGRGDAKDRGGLDFKFGPYDQEHYALVEAIRNGTAYNEGHYGATSSFTAVLGRMATYSGKVIRWDEAVKRGEDLCPGIESYTWETTPPVVPDDNGLYPYALPGHYDPFVAKEA